MWMPSYVFTLNHLKWLLLSGPFIRTWRGRVNSEQWLATTLFYYVTDRKFLCHLNNFCFNCNKNKLSPTTVVLVDDCNPGSQRERMVYHHPPKLIPSSLSFIFTNTKTIEIHNFIPIGSRHLHRIILNSLHIHNHSTDSHPLGFHQKNGGRAQKRTLKPLPAQNSNVTGFWFINTPRALYCFTGFALVVLPDVVVVQPEAPSSTLVHSSSLPTDQELNPGQRNEQQPAMNGWDLEVVPLPKHSSTSIPGVVLSGMAQRWWRGGGWLVGLLLQEPAMLDERAERVLFWKFC